MIEGKKASILLVEPDNGIRRTVRDALSPQDYHVLEIPKVNEAMGTAKVVLFDLLIVDPFLPFILDLANSMAKVNSRQKVLYLSDYSPETVKSFGLCPPGLEVCRKPISEKDLSERVKLCLASGETWAQLSRDWHCPRTRERVYESNQEPTGLSEMA